MYECTYEFRKQKADNRLSVLPVFNLPCGLSGGMDIRRDILLVHRGNASKSRYPIWPLAPYIRYWGSGDLCNEAVEEEPSVIVRTLAGVCHGCTCSHHHD